MKKKNRIDTRNKAIEDLTNAIINGDIDSNNLHDKKKEIAKKYNCAIPSDKEILGIVEKSNKDAYISFLENKENKHEDIKDGSDSSDGSDRVNLDLIAIISITAIAAILRIYNLGYESIWLDEAFSIRTASASSNLTTVWNLALQDVHPPLHFMILHFIQIIFGNSEFMMRLPSAIFGILTIPMVYMIGKEFFGKEEGLVAAFIVALSPMYLFYSQEARMYTQTVLFSISSLFFFYRGMKTNMRNDWILFIISSVLAFYTHYYTIFVFISEGIFFIITKIIDITKNGIDVLKNKASLTTIASFVILLIAGSPLLSAFLKSAAAKTSSAPTWGMHQSLSMVPAIMSQFTTFIGQNDILFYLFISLFIAGFVIIIFKQRELSLLLGMYLIIPFMASYLLSAVMPFQPRYIMYLLPVYILVIAKGAIGIIGFIFKDIKNNTKNQNNQYKNQSRKNNSINTNKIISICIFVIVFTFLNYSILVQYYTIPNKEDWRGVAQYIKQNLKAGDTITLLPTYLSDPFLYYYNFSNYGTRMSYLDDNYSGEGLDNIVSKSQNVTFLMTGDISAADPNGNVINWLRKNANFINQFNGIYVFNLKNWKEIGTYLTNNVKPSDIVVEIPQDIPLSKYYNGQVSPLSEYSELSLNNIISSNNDKKIWFVFTDDFMVQEEPQKQMLQLLDANSKLVFEDTNIFVFSK